MKLELNDEQRRLLANLDQFYGAWLAAERTLQEFGPVWLSWKRVGDREYLYEGFDRYGNAKSLGPRSPETETRHEKYRTAKDAQAGARKRLAEAGRMYRALRLPMLASEAAKILREADVRGLLGTNLMVVGTNAVPAYEIEAQRRFIVGLDETEDFDMAWVGSNTTFAVTGKPSSPIFDLLKSVDDTYTVNTERPFQARNANAYAVELLVAPSTAASMPSGEKLQPQPMPEQEWLLQGKRVEHTLCARDGTCARLVVPDPRWFALHKLWLGAQPKRNPLKRPKDTKQGEALLHLVTDAMPHYPLDDEFVKSLPKELITYLEKWSEKTVYER